MHIFQAILPILLALTTTIIAGNCVGSGKDCTLYMKWFHGTHGLAAGFMDPPAELTVFSKSCAALKSTMEQPTKNGQIIISAETLPSNITVTGQDEIGRPLFLYNGIKQGHEHCGQGTYTDGVGYSCAFFC